MKLVIQVPCLNEEGTLRRTLADLPGPFPPFRSVEVVVIDDGSDDKTADIAQEMGAHVVGWPQNRGLARAFEAGLETSLALGADVIVNTDGDHQYRGCDVPNLVAPILDGSAGMVVGDRGDPPHFSFGRRWLGRVGNAVIRWSSRLASVADASSGFRAFSRQAAMATVVYSTFSYTLESLILARERNIAVQWVPVRVNPPLRPPRLYTSTQGYLYRSAITILRTTWMTQPLRVLLPCLAVVWGTMIGGSIFAASAFASPGILDGVILVVMLQVVLAGWLGSTGKRNRRAMERRLLQLNEKTPVFRLDDNEGVDSPSLTG